MAEESPVTLISSESSDASIIETSDNDDTSKYSVDADSNKLKTTETIDSDNSDKITDENFDTKVEVDDEIEGEVEAETKSNDEFLENQNASIDSGLDYGETPLVDFAHEEEDEIDTEKYQGGNMTTASITSTAIQGEIVEAGDALQEEAVNGDDANIDDTYASPTKIEVDADSDVEAEGKVEAEAVTGVKAEAEVETDADAEVEGETEAEAGGETDAEIKIDVEASEIYDAIENQNASSDSGLDSGETRPLVDPEHEENIADKEDEADTDQDQGENITTASITSIATVGDMLEEDDDSQEKAVNGDEVSVNDAGSLLSTIEVDAETEVEIDTKTDEEVSKENNAIENQNASSDSGVEQGRTGPQVDPVGDDANIDDTYASPTKIEVDADSDVEAEGKVEAEAVTGVKAEAEVETDADAEVEGETEAEAGGETDAEIKIDVEASEIYDAIENQNASSDSGLDSGETRPLVDPEHEENIADKEDEADTDQDQGENITTASITSIATVGDMLEEDDDSQEKAVNGDEVSVNDAGSLLSTIEVDAETEVEIDTKTDEEVSKENNAIENQNASSDSGVEQGRTGPQVDPVGEEKVARKEDDTNTDNDQGTGPQVDPVGEEKVARKEDDTNTDNDQGEKSTTTSITSTAIVGEMFNEVDALQEKTVHGDEVGIYDADSSLTASATITPTKNKYKANGEELVVEEEKIEDHSHAKNYTLDDTEQEKLQSNLKSSKKENAKDQQFQLPPSSTPTETMDMLSSCHPTLRNVKGLECTFQSTVSSHPAGSLAASLTIFFFCYCACRMRGGIGDKNWRKRMRNFRMRKRGNEGQGEYASLAVYDELLDSFDDEELSSLYLSRDNDDDGSDSSMSTILSEWSGKNHDIEMSCLEDDLDDYIKDE
eukprot:CAMPEP_0198279034 /NCGR_PEP_ID=MMETSP1447-20131203/66699_1 /TAXON_ID=420782 /ORGANISM="Chaetoceros dichaeta, Strain CCMP1751" /LENGTH=891 /DNA_ID=CAMNT_0043974163 /DNA_START=117 /DNA_END=2792 /DNA_ORIENTATION=+